MGETNWRKLVDGSVEFEIKGKKYKFHPITIGDMAKFESKLLQDKMDTVLKRVDFNSDRERADFIISLYEKGVSREEMQTKMSSIEGTFFLLWCSLRDEKIAMEQFSLQVDASNVDVLSDILSLMMGISEEKEDTKESKKVGVWMKQ